MTNSKPPFLRQHTLSGDVHVDNAYLGGGGESGGGKAGRGSDNKVPFVTAISLSAESRPLYIKMAAVPGFTRKAIVGGANADLSPGCIVTSDGLGCFAGVTDAGCQHRVIFAGDRKPMDLQEFTWINTVLGNLKTSLGALIMRLISPNTELTTSARLFIGLTGASILKPFRCVYSSLLPLLGIARRVSFAKLKNLANQVIRWRVKKHLPKVHS